MTTSKIFLKRGRAGPTYGRHPWVFSDAIERVDGSPAEGDAVAVYGERDNFLAWGYFNSKSQIRVRLFSWIETEPLTKDFLFRKIQKAIQIRRDVLKVWSPSGACRLVFSDGDELSGLVVDQFAEILVVQITSLALYRRKEEVVAALRELLNPKGIYLRCDKNILKAEGVEAEDGILFGDVPTEPVVVIENEIKFKVDIRSGQKTGFFSDQRDNRMVARIFSEGKRVLDLCTYTGGFALNSAKAGARAVVGVDSSDEAIRIAKENAELNGFSNMEFYSEDVFEFLQKQTEPFDMIVLDPPRFAPSRGAKEKALKAYYRLNLEAISRLTPGGVFVSCSCSHQIGRQDFHAMLSSVFRKAGRAGRLLYQGTQAADHPISMSCPETQYLKSFFCLVE